MSSKQTNRKLQPAFFIKFHQSFQVCFNLIQNYCYNNIAGIHSLASLINQIKTYFGINGLNPEMKLICCSWLIKEAMNCPLMKQQNINYSYCRLAAIIQLASIHHSRLEFAHSASLFLLANYSFLDFIIHSVIQFIAYISFPPRFIH